MPQGVEACRRGDGLVLALDQSIYPPGDPCENMGGIYFPVRSWQVRRP